MRAMLPTNREIAAGSTGLFVLPCLLTGSIPKNLTPHFSYSDGMTMRRKIKRSLRDLPPARSKKNQIGCEALQSDDSNN